MVAPFRLFVRVFVDLMMREHTLIPGFATRFRFDRLDIGENASTHKAISCKYLSNSIHTVVEE